MGWYRSEPGSVFLQSLSYGCVPGRPVPRYLKPPFISILGFYET